MHCVSVVTSDTIRTEYSTIQYKDSKKQQLQLPTLRPLSLVVVAQFDSTLSTWQRNDVATLCSNVLVHPNVNPTLGWREKRYRRPYIIVQWNPIYRIFLLIMPINCFCRSKTTQLALSNNKKGGENTKIPKIFQFRTIEWLKLCSPKQNN